MCVLRGVEVSSVRANRQCLFSLRASLSLRSFCHWYVDLELRAGVCEVGEGQRHFELFLIPTFRQIT